MVLVACHCFPINSDHRYGFDLILIFGKKINSRRSCPYKFFVNLSRCNFFRKQCLFELVYDPMEISIDLGLHIG